MRHLDRGLEIRGRAKVVSAQAQRRDLDVRVFSKGPHGHRRRGIRHEVMDALQPVLDLASTSCHVAPVTTGCNAERSRLSFTAECEYWMGFRKEGSRGHRAS